MVCCSDRFPPPFLSFFFPLPSIIIAEETGESPADVQRKKRLSTLGSAVAGPGGASFERTQLPNVGQIGRWTVLGYCLAVAGPEWPTRVARVWCSEVLGICWV